MVGIRWSLVAVLLVACHPAIPPLPSRGGPAWFEIKSEHFTLWTDTSVARGHELVRKMEHHRQVVMRVMNNAPSRARSFVIGLRDEREMAAFLPDKVAGLSWPAWGPTRQPGIILAVDTKDRVRVINHELTHVICFGIFRKLPTWLAEGLASYFETADLEPGKTRVKIGLPREDHAAFLFVSGPIPIAELLACNDPICSMNEGFYPTSWALFSFLFNVHTDQLIHYLRRLQQVPVDQQATLWHDSFPELTPDKLDPLLKRWIISESFATPVVEVSVLEFPTLERPLGDGDALAARSLVHLVAADDKSAMRADLAAALALDRTNVLARLVEAALLGSIDPDAARDTAAAHPADWRAWWLVASAVRQGHEAAEALVKLCALASNQAPECAR
jgi:hypothetical protein